ncbi:MAG TPA: serine/threonine-protein kinase [Gemmatimonadaceae bacterium]|nr:serine/threonine-protein kinase [Gemmatimonadaceae bacterium]
MAVEQFVVLVDSLVAGRYRITRTIGAGGMATIYEAVDLTTDRPVALKLLSRALSGSIADDRFLREIAVTSRLRHPLIVPVLDSGTHEGSPFFVMPLVAGESLRDRLEREKQLSIADAIRVARDVLSALQAAHAQNVVHRDIKPSNILLHEGRAIVADFGIARAYSEAAADRVTESGVAIGTAGYMSPEQACGETRLDGRTDIYAAGCLLYEMLAGEPPFNGPTPQSIVAKQLSLPVPSLGVVRSTIPASLDTLIQQALAKTPADRIATASEFDRALERIQSSTTPESRVPRVRPLRREWTVGVGALGFVLSAVLASRAPSFGSSVAHSLTDTTTYSIVTQRADVAPNVLPDLPDLLREALGRWSGVSVSDSAVPGAGRSLRAVLSRAGDSVRLRLTLNESNGAMLADFTERFRASDSTNSARVAYAVDRLLFRGSAPPNELAAQATRSLASRQALAAGIAAVEAWQLSAADSLLQMALAYDPRYPRAHLWLALVRAWLDVEPARWRGSAQQAVAGVGELLPPETRIAEAIAAQSTGDYARACPAWRALTRSDSTDALSWFGSAHCQRNDALVIADSKSASGYRFRTSYDAALRAYRKAFDLRPAILQAFSHQQLRELYQMAGSRRRDGWSASPDSQYFAADAEWRGDTLVYVPYLASTRRRGADPARSDEAVRKLRIQVRDLASSWVTHAPNGASAREALALALAELGDNSALDTLAVAQRLAGNDADRLRIAVSVVWLRLGSAVTLGQPERVRAVAELADSLLRSNPPPSGDGSLLAPLAALTGRSHLAAAYARLPGMGVTFDVPATLRESAAPLLVYAALGGPADSILTLERRADAAIDATVPPGERVFEKLAYLARAATLAYPTHRMHVLSTLVGQGDGLLDLQVALDRGESTFVRDSLARMRRTRSQLSPEEITLDAILPETQLLMALGDNTAAAAWMDPTLTTFGQAIPRLRSEHIEAASVGRLLALRAQIAARLGEHEDAVRWSRFVRLLWSRADAHLIKLLDSLPSSP